jgi:hypothetical protein
LTGAGGWTKSGGALATTDGTLSSDGVTLARKVTSGGGRVQAYPNDPLTTVASVAYTYSFEVIYGNHPYAYLSIGSWDYSAHGFAAVFDISTASDGVATEQLTGAASGTILYTRKRYLGNNRYRLTICGTVNVTLVYGSIGLAPLATGNSLNYGDIQGNISAGAYAYFCHAMLERGATESSYIYTFGSAASRAPESCIFDLSAKDFSSNEWTIVAGHTTAYGINNAGNSQEYVWADDGTSVANDHAALDSGFGAIGMLYAYISFTDGSGSDNLGGAVTDGAMTKWAASSKNGAQAISISGGAPVTNSVAQTSAPPKRINLGAYTGGAGYEGNNEWAELSVYNAAFSGAALQALAA